MDFSFDTVRKVWKMLKPMRSASYLGTSGSAMVQGKQIWLSRAGNAQIDVYDPEKDQWTQFSRTQKCRSRTILTEFGTSIYAMGGGANDIVERYDPRAHLWISVRKISCYT